MVKAWIVEPDGAKHHLVTVEVLAINNNRSEPKRVLVGINTNADQQRSIDPTEEYLFYRYVGIGEAITIAIED